MSEIDRVRAQQRELYGAPLNELLGRCGAALNLNQGQTAKLLGVSAPMLSQLVNGHRIKLANPAAGIRLATMVQAAEAVSNGELTVEQAVARVEETDPADTYTSTARLRHRPALAAEIRQVFRATASADEFAAAAQLLQGEHPAVAELLAAYGTASEEKAAAWTETTLRG